MASVSALSRRAGSHFRHHTPFCLYAAASLIVMGWVVIQLARL